MISVPITNTMLEYIVSIETCRTRFPKSKLPKTISMRLRKNSKKKSTHASTAIEGNPLTEEQVSEVLESKRRHYLNPEEEVRNYYAALGLLEQKLKKRTPFSKDLVLEVQKLIVKGEGSEKAGIRGPMPPGVLFAVYDSTTNKPEYIPPDVSEVERLLDELDSYIATSEDHPLIKAGIIHYQLVTIHPFEDGNGRTARIMSGYYLDLAGFDFGGIGSLEEYFAYDAEEYYQALQMGLPALYYEGRNNPPHPEIWMEYFLHMVALYAQKASSLAHSSSMEQFGASLSHVNTREREFYNYLVRHEVAEYTPIELAKKFSVSNRTIINWSAALAKAGLVEPQLVKKRIRSYKTLLP